MSIYTLNLKTIDTVVFFFLISKTHYALMFEGERSLSKFDT